MTFPTVLIADDNPEWRSVIADILRSEYDVVRQVERGDEVLAAACALQPDFITLDVSMPGISGLNVLPHLRQALPHTVIVMVSTNSSKLYVDEAYRRGADGYVSKSSAWRDLVPTLQAARAPRLSALRA